VNRRVARWYGELQDYWFEIKHVPGKTHTAADFLSRPFVDDKGERDNEDVVVLPPELFINNNAAIRVFDIDSIFGDLDQMVAITQDQYRPLMKTWQTEYDTTTVSTLRPPCDEVRGWRKEGRLVIPPNLTLKRKIMFHIHNAVGPRHPNLSKTLHQAARLYWWPGMEAWVTKYVKNCEQCHHNPIAARTTSPMTTSLRSKIHEAQERHRIVLREWSSLHPISEEVGEEQSNWQKEGHLVIPPDETLKREILQLLHDAPTAGHPGRDETFAQVSRSYWWPGMRSWITDYVAGCAVCQQNKNITHHMRTPLYRIPTAKA